MTSLAFVDVGWTVVDSLSRFSAEFFLDAAWTLELLLESTFASVFNAFSVESFFDAFPDAFDVTAVATVVDAAAVVVCLSPEGKESFYRIDSKV